MSNLFPTNQSAVDELGARAASLLTNGCEWIRRRKEKVTMVDETIVRRQMSIDFELPPADPLLLSDGVEVHYAPLFFLPKGSDGKFDPVAPLRDPEPHFANFDFRDERGDALTLPARAWNAQVSAAMLAAVIDDAVGRRGVSLDQGQRGRFQRFSRLLAPLDLHKAEARVGELRRGEFQEAEPMAGDLRLLRALDRDDPELSWVLDAVAISSVVMIPLFGMGGRGGIRKLSYDHQISPITGERLQRLRARFGWTGTELWVDSPFIGARNFHFEFEAPAGVEVFDAGMFEVVEGSSPADVSHRLARASGLASRVHLYASGATHLRGAVSWVRLRVRRQAFVGGAVIAAGLVTAVLWAGYLLRQGVKESAPRDLSVLLLLFPSAIGTYVVRPGQHPLTSRMLLWARLLLAACSALPFIAAAAVALTPREDGEFVSASFGGWWLGCAIAASVCLVGLVAAWALPAPELQLRKWERRLGLDIRRANRDRDVVHPEPLLARMRSRRKR